MTGSIIWLRLLHNPDFYHIGTAQSAVPAMAIINLNPARGGAHLWGIGVEK
jgi:hypothetical protein